LTIDRGKKKINLRSLLMRVQGPRFNEIEPILLVESHKLDPPPLDERGPKTKKWQIEAKTYMA
jgi:hypothetical protein